MLKTVDKCSVEYVSHMGSDLTVVNAARVSFDKESEYEVLYKGRIAEYDGDVVYPDFDIELNESDKKLIKYLAKHNHWTPFAHPQITLRETVPIFVARQRFKHMVGFTYNEVSRRYVSDEPSFYAPKVWRSKPEGSAKQGSGSYVVYTIPTKYIDNYGEIHDDNPFISEAYAEHLALSRQLYDSMLEAGVAPEQARMVLPQSMMTSYYVTGSLAAFARLVKQRKDAHAQREIQELAEQIETIIAPLFPESWAALIN